MGGRSPLSPSHRARRPGHREAILYGGIVTVGRPPGAPCSRVSVCTLARLPLPRQWWDQSASSRSLWHLVSLLHPAPHPQGWLHQTPSAVRAAWPAFLGKALHSPKHLDSVATTCSPTIWISNVFGPRKALTQQACYCWYTDFIFGDSLTQQVQPYWLSGRAMGIFDSLSWKHSFLCLPAGVSNNQGTIWTACFSPTSHP